VGLPYKYREVLEYLRSSGLRAEDRVLRPLPFPQPARASPPLRDYQRRAVDAQGPCGRGGGPWARRVIIN